MTTTTTTLTAGEILANNTICGNCREVFECESYNMDYPLPYILSCSCRDEEGRRYLYELA